MYAFETERFELDGSLELQPPKFKRILPVTEELLDHSVFNCSVFYEPMQAYPWRMYYNNKESRCNTHQAAFIRRSKDGRKWEAEKPLRFIGIPAKAQIIHLSVLPPCKEDRYWRLFGWLFLPEKNFIRYIMFWSEDALLWETDVFDTPGIIHPMDCSAGGKAGFEGLVPFVSDLPDMINLDAEKLLRCRSRLANDASTVNRLPGGGFEFLGVWLANNPPGGWHEAKKDNVPTVYRIIQRRTSMDGVHWSSPEIIFAPDRNDSPLLQLYNLTVTDLKKLRIGLLDRYDCEQQSIEPEFIYSYGSQSWHRPRRSPWLQLADEEGNPGLIHSSHHFVDVGDWIRLYYTVSFFHHNNAFQMQPRPRVRSIRAVEFLRDRYLGMTGSGRLESPLLFYTPEKLTINAEIRGEMRCELLDINGSPIPGCSLADSIPIQGDSLNHRICWHNHANPVMTEARLRMQMKDGTFYRINTF